MAREVKKGPRPASKRTVKPRKRVETNKPIMAVHEDKVLLETGEFYPYEDLPTLILVQPSSIVVAHLVGHMIRDLDTAFADNPNWQFRASPLKREMFGPNKQARTYIRDTIFSYFGFRGANKQKGHYHYPLSPQLFCLKTANELRRGIPEPHDTIIKLMEWAKEIRRFLAQNGLALSPTSGGVAAQLLKDDRFYPNPRRKVPRLTNERAREFLPGNFYKLYEAKEGHRVFRASYLDQVSAHHTAAMEIDFPDANTLQRRGRYATLEDRSYARAGTEKFEKLISQYGLFYLAIETPRFFKSDFPLPQVDDDKPGYKRAFFFSNELPYLRELKVRIRHIIACWTSPDLDTGLNLYAKWAAQTIRESGSYAKPWLKPTLLSTYGVLAAKPKKQEFAYKRAKNSEEKQYPCGSGFITVQARETKNELEMPQANVIHRGMIEAETRVRSLQFAKELTKFYGQDVLAIYADSVFTQDGAPLPLLPPTWRIEGELTGLKFYDATNFTSVQLTKMPGTPESLRAMRKRTKISIPRKHQSEERKNVLGGPSLPLARTTNY